MINLPYLMDIEKIQDYNVWWYGSAVTDKYLGTDGLTKATVEVKKGASLERIYLIMEGLSGRTCIYRFAIRLKRQVDEDIYEWERVRLHLDDYAGRMVFYRESGFSFYNSKSASFDFVVDEIYGKQEKRLVSQFTDYDSVELTFDDLSEIVSNHYSDYYKAFSSVKAVYMIIDGNTGKLYIGSAYGEDGIWGRWSTYVETCHGNNEALVELYNEKGYDYFKKFKYIILHILPMKASSADVIALESMYKDRFLTKTFGLNRN